MPKPKLCNGAGAVVAFSWVALPNNSIARYMVRYCPTCHQSHVSLMRYIDDEYYYCPACLGQRVTTERAKRGLIRIECHECGQLSMYPEDQQDEPMFDEPDEDFDSDDLEL